MEAGDCGNKSGGSGSTLSSDRQLASELDQSQLSTTDVAASRTTNNDDDDYYYYSEAGLYIPPSLISSHFYQILSSTSYLYCVLLLRFVNVNFKR